MRFAAIYGHIWKSLYKNTEFLNLTKKEWKEALSNFEDKIIEEAICYCREMREYPPTLPQFIDHCKVFERSKVKTFVPEYVLEKKPLTPEQIEAQKERMKTIYTMLKRVK